MNFWESLTSLLGSIPLEWQTRIAIVFGVGGFFWYLWDKIAETKRAKLDATISLRQIAQDENRAAMDISSQQTETQLRISEAQQQATSYLAEKITDYTNKMKAIGDLFDSIELLAEENYSADGMKEAIKQIRKTRRELGI